MAHKYNPEQHILILFDKLKRKEKELLPANYLEAEALGEEWVEQTGGAYVINFCMKNSELPRKQRWMK